MRNLFVSPSRPVLGVAIAAALCVAQPAFAADNPAQSATLQSAKAGSNADAAVQAQLATLMQQWTAAAISFSHQVGAGIPWNQNQTTTPIAYAPMFLYAGPGGAASCRFTAAAGTALPAVAGINLSSPVNLAGTSLNLSAAGTQQASAYQQVLGNGNTFFPANASGPFGGTYCAAVAFNSPAAQQMSVSTWYAPSPTAMQQTTAAQSTPRMAVFKAAQSFTNSLNQSTMGGSLSPVYTMNANGQAQSWMNGSTSKASQFMGGTPGSTGN